ncbi:MAG: Hsp20/alpha crystallin family protein [Betaproteobacteria bacterium]|nr:Hsp20/alpha crystallin family protein [Betaproteobacteria bacterium]
MTNVVRREPNAINTMLDELFKGFLVRPLGDFAGVPEMQMIKMDLKEGEREYTVHAELPGVNKEDIHVSIEGNTVSIEGEVKKASEEKEGDKLLRSERYHGKVSRSFTLGQEVDEGAAKARFEKGVLELVLPKKTPAAAKKLTIE